MRRLGEDMSALKRLAELDLPDDGSLQKAVDELDSARKDLDA
jgi:hypothetical protein